MSVIKLCHNCVYNMDTVNRGKIFLRIKSNDGKFNRNFITTLVSLAFPAPHEQLTWDVTMLGIYGEAEVVIRHVQLCTNHYFKRKTLTKGIFQSPVDRMAHSTVYILHSIMKNNSYSISENLKCENGKIVENFEDLSGSEFGDIFSSPFMLNWISKQSFLPNIKIELIWFQNRLNTLRIVSCGQKSSSPFPFASLVNVYSVNAWITGIIFTVLVSIGTWKMYDFKYTLVDTISMALKNLVEQGDSFTPKLCNNKHMRILISGFLLGGVVLSNAYKNNNVYNMITHRRPVLYDTLEELIKDDFTIYTRMKYMATWPLAYIPNRTVLIVNQHTVTMTGFRLSYSEVNLAITSTPNDYNEKQLENLQNHSMIYPKALSFLRKIVDEFHKFYLKSKGKDDAILNQRFKELVYRKDEDILYNELMKCSKTAVILPKYLAHNFAERLQRSDVPYGKVGSQRFKEVNTAFNIDRLVPPFLMKRISGVEASGIIDWWKRFVGKEYLPQKLPSELVKSATMYGNILVIFIVLLGGLTISCGVYVLEILPLLCFRVWKTVLRSRTVEFISVLFRKFFHRCFKEDVISLDLTVSISED